MQTYSDVSVSIAIEKTLNYPICVFASIGARLFVSQRRQTGEGLNFADYFADPGIINNKYSILLKFMFSSATSVS